MQLTKILLPTDFSERSAGAAHYAKALACRFHSNVHIAHVFELTALLSTTPETGLPAGWYEEQKEQARRALSEFQAEEFRSMPVQRSLLEGDVARQIVDLAHSEHADLIVIPTHGYGSFRRFVLGSVTAKVLHDADCPVLTGVHLEHAPALAPVVFQNVVCAIDFDSTGERALRWAAKFAEGFGAGLTLVHALPVTYGSELDFADSGLKGMLQDVAQKQADDLIRLVGAPAKVVTEMGSVAQVVRKTATAESADLVVIGRHESSGLMGRLRAHSYAIVRESPCPVVSV
jgi:nucleotide-binding universal stress UspA family protein